MHDALCPKVKVADIAAFFPVDKITTKEKEYGVFRYADESLSGTDRTSAPGRRLLAALQKDISTRLAADGLVWQQHFQSHLDRIELVLATITGGSKRIERMPQDAKIAAMPKTIPLSNFSPEDWGDLPPWGYDEYAPETPEADRTRLYFILYNIAGGKIAGEVCTISGSFQHSGARRNALLSSPSGTENQVWRLMARDAYLSTSTGARSSWTSPDSNGSVNLPLHPSRCKIL